jgi:threonine aldolase
VSQAVDLRSDTVTKPSAAMRRAMAEAEVGDDVFAEDPTVRKLEETVAGLLGKEAALYVPTGSMANQISIRVHAPPATEVILEARAHIFNNEMAAMAALSGLLPRPVTTSDGILTAALAEAVIQAESPIRPRTSLICVENTHNHWGGRTMPAEASEALRELSERRRLPLHLDGSRLWNAHVASGIALKELARGFATVNVCFSKGLGAPVGSAVTGSRDAIAEARRIRKLFGGGMRQAGVIAAAALVSLQNIGRLAEDHARARKLAAAVAEIKELEFDLSKVETNIVIFRFKDKRPVAPTVRSFADRGVLVSSISATEIRMVTHLDVDDAGIERAKAAIREVL